MQLGRHLVNILGLVWPVRETIGFRRVLLRWSGIAVGRGTRITHGVKFYDRYIRIGSNVWIGMNTVIASAVGAEIVIGDNVDIAPCCRIVSGTHELGNAERRAGQGFGRDVSIGPGSWIGVGSCVLPGAKIGAGSVVAAGSVVIAGDYPSNVLLAGVPAHVKRALP
jgi:maltose O-acetyltransferase